MKLPQYFVLYGPPGTGKTRRLLKVIDEHCHEHTGRVLFSSHTRAAAQEALSRWPEDKSHRVDIQTLHSLCFRALGLSRAQTVDDSKLADFGAKFGIDMSEEGLGKEFMDVLGLARARLVVPAQAYEQSWRPGTESHFAAFAKSYQQWKDSFGYLDFNDMLEQGALRIEARDVAYSLIAIDEAQDLTPLHWSVIDRLIEVLPDVPIIVAGDDDQALYSFAGADPMAMQDFCIRMGGKSHVLSQSYRITEQTYNIARAIILQVKNRVDKRYAPRIGLDGHPAQGVVETWPHVDHMRPSRERDTLVLYADRFVRREIEPILKEERYNYSALNGYSAPLDLRAGKALSCVFQHGDNTILGDDELRNRVRGALSKRGQDVWDKISDRQVLSSLRRHDFTLMSVQRECWEYYQAVDYTKPNNIRISTMHGAKGLQADDVHLVLSLSARAWSEAAVEPDHLHRLIYTAVTRTKENLYIYDGENGYELPAKFR